MVVLEIHIIDVQPTTVQQPLNIDLNLKGISIRMLKYIGKYIEMYAYIETLCSICAVNYYGGID